MTATTEAPVTPESYAPSPGKRWYVVHAYSGMEKAVEIILKKGLAKSAKRAGAVATEGEVRAAVTSDAKAGVLVEVNIQTDFAARNTKSSPRSWSHSTEPECGTGGSKCSSTGDARVAPY